MNQAHGDAFYDVPAAAEIDAAAAEATFAAGGPVVDVQTHLVRPSRSTTRAAAPGSSFEKASTSGPTMPSFIHSNSVPSTARLARVFFTTRK